MKGERLHDQADITVFNSDGTVVERQKAAIIGGRIRPTLPAGEIVVSYSMDSVRPNRAERRRKKSK